MTTSRQKRTASLAARLFDLREDIFYLSEHIAEISAENRMEVALFGDSGPGSAWRLNQSRRDLARLRRKETRLMNRLTDGRKPDPVDWTKPEAYDDDIPF